MMEEIWDCYSMLPESRKDGEGHFREHQRSINKLFQGEGMTFNLALHHVSGGNLTQKEASRKVS